MVTLESANNLRATYFRFEEFKKQESSKAYTVLPVSTLDTQTVQVFDTVLSIHLNLQFQLHSVRELFKDLNVMSSSLSADRVKFEPESIKGSFEQTRECIR